MAAQGFGFTHFVHLQLGFFKERAAEKRPVLRFFGLRFQECYLVLLATSSTDQSRNRPKGRAAICGLGLTKVEEP